MIIFSYLDIYSYILFEKRLIFKISEEDILDDDPTETEIIKHSLLQVDIVCKVSMRTSFIYDKKGKGIDLKFYLSMKER